MADGDLPSVSVSTNDVANDTNDTNDTNNDDDATSRHHGIMIPVSRLRDHLLISALAAVLALVLFILTLLWDQNLWIAPLALITLILSGTYALWCGRTLARFILHRG